MEYLDMLFQNGGETYTYEEIMMHLTQHMAVKEAEAIISEAEKKGYIYLASIVNGSKVYVR